MNEFSKKERSQSELKAMVLEALETVIDPELEIDIVNLGLIYRVNINETGSCTITMTLTTIGCPLTDFLSSMIKDALLRIEEIKDVKINLTFDPPWTIDRLSRYAKVSLGLS